MAKSTARLLAVLMAVLIGLHISQAAAQSRRALVIGVDDYRNVTKLQKAVGDARAMKLALEKARFEVDLLVNPDRAGFNSGISEFTRKLGPNDVALIHYSGHGVALDGEKGRGSARSIPGFHLYEALSECARLLRRFGGHRQAAGMDLTRASLDDFRVAFNAAARARLSDDHLRPVLQPDIELDLAAVDGKLVHWLSYLGPHGVGNPGPLFIARNVVLDRARRVGDDHLKATLSSGSARLEAIGAPVSEHPEGLLSHDPSGIPVVITQEGSQ